MKIDEAKKRQAVSRANNTSIDDESSSVSSTPKGNNIFKKGFSSLKGLLGANKQNNTQAS